MKRCFLLLVGLLASGFLAQSCSTAETNPLLGTWVVDVEQTKQHRRALEGVPPGLSFEPSAEEVIARTLVFAEDRLRASARGMEVTSRYEILKTEGGRMLLKLISDGDTAPLYSWWSFPAPGRAVNYIAVADLNNPLLTSEQVPTFYRKVD